MATESKPNKSAAIKEFLATNKKASPREIVAALKEKGIEVSVGLAGVVKYKQMGKKKRRKAAAGKATASGKAQPAVSASESIRQYIAKHPQATPKEIQAGLKSEGVNVKLGLVGVVKYATRRKSGKKVRGRAAAATVAAPAKSLGFEHLVEVKKLADSLGGIDHVRQALDALASLQ